MSFDFSVARRMAETPPIFDEGFATQRVASRKALIVNQLSAIVRTSDYDVDACMGSKS